MEYFTCWLQCLILRFSPPVQRRRRQSIPVDDGCYLVMYDHSIVNKNTIPPPKNKKSKTGERMSESLTVNSESIAAGRLYEKLGFEIVGTARRELKVQGRFHDLHYMELHF